MRKLKDEAPVDLAAPGLLSPLSKLAAAQALASDPATIRDSVRLMGSLSPSEMAVILSEREEFPPRMPWDSWVFHPNPAYAAVAVRQLSSFLKSDACRSSRYGSDAAKRKATVLADRLAEAVAWSPHADVRLARESAKMLRSADGLPRGYGQTASHMDDWRDVVSGWAWKGSVPAMAWILGAVPRRPLLDSPEGKSSNGWGLSAASSFWAHGSTSRESTRNAALGAKAWIERDRFKAEFVQPHEALFAGKASGPERDRIAVALARHGFRPGALAMALAAGAASDDAWAAMAEAREALYHDKPNSIDFWRSERDGSAETLALAAGTLPADAFKAAVERYFLAVHKAPAPEKLPDALAAPFAKRGRHGVPMAFLFAFSGAAGALEALADGKTALRIHCGLAEPSESTVAVSPAFPGLRAGSDPFPGSVKIGLASAACLALDPATLSVAKARAKESPAEMEAAAAALGGSAGEAILSGALKLASAPKRKASAPKA